MNKLENQEIINQLFKSRKLSSKKEYEQFESSLVELQESIQISDVCEICKVFCDDTEDDEVMFEVIHLIEQFQGEEYLKCIALCTPDMSDAHDWAMTLNKRILNSQRYFAKYLEIVNSLERVQKAKIVGLLIDIKNDNPKKFGEKVDCILKKVNY